MLPCFTTDLKRTIPIYLVMAEQLNTFIEAQSVMTKQWVLASQFKAKPEQILLVPDSAGHLAAVLLGIANKTDLWSVGHLATLLPQGIYRIVDSDDAVLYRHALAWGLGAYQYQRYKVSNKTLAQLYLTPAIDKQALTFEIEAHYFVRDLINTPAEHMGPAELADSALKIANEHQARVKQIIGGDLLTENFPMIYTVGRASTRAPRLIDLRWGDNKHPLVTLVGKGVCFDTGGLDIKPSSGMLSMKKDMGGAAHALGLARWIMQSQLPVQLRVLIPCVENVIAGNAYKPLDVIKTRQGMTVEVTNTDAEGRLILCDALFEATREKPRWLIDFATLTGAARIALGTDIAAFFTHHDAIASDLLRASEQQQDPIWRLPIYTPYRKLLDSNIADIANANVNTPYGGAITAALFLSEFVTEDTAWVHFDIMASNSSPRPGRPEGGEAMALRTVYYALREWCSKV